MSGPVDGRSRAPAGADVGATLREMWDTRPARRADDRKVAGVAAAVARRYAIDPTLVRVAFVAAAFYGVGVLAYLVGWLVLPRAEIDGTRRPTSGWAVVAAVVVALVTIGPLFGGRPGVLIGALVVLALLYALHRSRGGVAAEQARAQQAGAGTSAATPTGDGQPPAWDPLGAAPFAWDLPEPSTPPPPPAPRSRLVPATLGLALLAAGAMLVLGLLGLVPLGVTPVVAAALGVVGIGLVVGAFLGRARGLIAAAVPLGVVLVLASGPGPQGPWNGPWNDGDNSGFRGTSSDFRGTTDDQRWEPASAAAVQPTYRAGLGDADLDLRAIAPGTTARTSVEAGVGDVKVRVPETADVTAVCTSGIGDVDCLGRPGGPNPVIDPGPDGPGGPIIDLRVSSGTGDLEVSRG